MRGPGVRCGMTNETVLARTLAQPKARWCLTVGGAKVRVRNLQVWEGK